MLQKFKFITFEGIEGSGKSTQARLLHEFFLKNGQKSQLTREPGGCEAAEKIRMLLLDESLNLDVKTELFLNFAARIEHVEKKIKPAIARGEVVISDRFFDSTYAYQGGAMGIDFSIINQIHQAAIANFAPQLTFLIDLPVEAAFERIGNRAENNRYEKLGFDFHQKVRNSFLELAKKNSRIRVINGLENQEQIAQKIISEISKF